MTITRQVQVARLDVCIVASIGHSASVRPKYQDQSCLAGLDIRMVYSASISSHTYEQQKTRKPNDEANSWKSRGI
jgi:hypothetical protein